MRFRGCLISGLEPIEEIAKSAAVCLIDDPMKALLIKKILATTSKTIF